MARRYGLRTRAERQAFFRRKREAEKTLEPIRKMIGKEINYLRFANFANFA